MAGRLIVQEPPQLNAPYILVGMNGWLNAGEISTGSIDYLRRKLSARKFAYIETQGFYIYQTPSLSPELSMRPHTQIKDGLVMKLEIPQNDFFFWKSDSDHDLILLLGVEPNLSWPAYCQIILDVARQFQAPRIYFIGAVFDQVPHTRETRIRASVSHPGLKDELKTFARFTNYEGPCAFTTMLLTMGANQGIEVAGISARTSMYINDFNPLDSDCTCYTCRNFSRAYLRHLFLSGEILSCILNTIHNLSFYQDLMTSIQDAIRDQRFSEFKSHFRQNYINQ